MTAARWTEDAVRAVVRREFAVLLPDAELTGEDNFFRRGGDSLGMLRLISALDSHGLAVTAREFVTEPTPDAVVRNILARLSQPTG
jgi:aryl carrier-like protein